MVLALFSAMAAGAAPAQAATVAPAAMAVSVPQASGGGLCSGGASGSAGSGDANLYLSMNRWSEATGNIHTHVDNAFFGEQDKVIARESLTSGLFSSANAMWTITSNLTDFSIRYCAFDSVAQQVDSFVAQLGSTLGQSGLITILVVFALVSAVWKWRKGDGGGWKEVISKIAIVAIFVAMVSAAAGSTKTVETESSFLGFSWTTKEEVYDPTFMSPGWIVSTANSSLTSLGSLPAAALIGVQDAAKTDNGNKLSCDRYLETLDASYREAMGDGLNQVAASVPLSISRMWQGTVLASWQGIQYGTDAVPGLGEGSSATYSDSIYCHQLEWKSAAPISTRDNNWGGVSTSGVLARALGSGAESTESSQEFVRKALGVANGPEGDSQINGGQITPSRALQPVDNENVDRSLMAWGHCEISPGSWDFQINSHFKGAFEGKNPTAEDCSNWWSSDKKVSDAFDFDQDPGAVISKSENEAIASFINTTHGYKVWGGLALGLILNISSAATLVVFGLLAASVIVSKTLLAVMGLGVFFAVVGALMPGSGFARVKKMLMFLVGVIFMVLFSGLLYSVVVTLTGFLTSAAGGLIRSSSSAGIIWSGLAPVVVVVGIGMMFKKMKLPNPLSLKSGMAWGKSIANKGAGAAAGSSGIGRMARNAQRRAMRRQGAQMRRAIHGNGRGRSRGGVGPTGSQAERLKRSTNTRSGVPGGKETNDPITERLGSGRNSQAAKMAHTAGEAKMLRAAAATERRAAIDWEKGKVQKAAAAAGRNPDQKVRNFAKDAAFDAGERFRANPLGTVKRTAIAAGITGAAVLAAPVAMPVAAVAGAIALAGMPLAKRGMSNARNNMAARGWTAGNRDGRENMDQIVAAYRANSKVQEKGKTPPNPVQEGNRNYSRPDQSKQVQSRQPKKGSAHEAVVGREGQQPASGVKVQPVPSVIANPAVHPPLPPLPQPSRPPRPPMVPLSTPSLPEPVRPPRPPRKPRMNVNNLSSEEIINGK